MPETPDFDDWARQTYRTLILMQGIPDLSAEGVEQLAVRGLVTLLKNAWNVRGAADIARVNAELSSLLGVAKADPYVKHLDWALHTLDR